MDMLVEQTHDLRYEWRNNERPLRFTDTRVDEQSRGISMKSTPMSLVLEASNGKSFVMNMVDTPGAACLPAGHLEKEKTTPVGVTKEILMVNLLITYMHAASVDSRFTGVDSRFTAGWSKASLHTPMLRVLLVPVSCNVTNTKM